MEVDSNASRYRRPEQLNQYNDGGQQNQEGAEKRDQAEP